MLSGGRSQWVLQNVTKFKSIGPCVQEIEAKMRVNLVVLGVTKTLNFWRLPSISPKVSKIGIPSVVYKICSSFEVKNHRFQNQIYPHSSSRLKLCLVTARGARARARARRSQPGEKCEGNWKIFLMPLVQSTLPDLCQIVNFGPIYKMWSNWGQNCGNFTLFTINEPAVYPHKWHLKQFKS